MEYYRNPDIRSNQMYVNEWNQMDDILSHRSDSPHLYQPYIINKFNILKRKRIFVFYFRSSSDEGTLRTRIHVKLKEIMLQVDLDEVTSKFVKKNSFFFYLN